MVVYNEQLRSAIVTKIEQKSDLFNAASGGAIVLRNAGNMGDFTQTSYWNGVQSALRDVDAYATNSAVANTEMSQDLYSTVKRMKAFGPVAFQENDLTWIASNRTEALRVMSESMSDAIMADQINTAIGVLVASIGNVALATNDVSASAGVSQVTLNNTHALYGDASQKLVTQVMTGSVSHKILGQALENGATLFTAENVRVIDILGKTSIITDSPDLYLAGTPNKEFVLCLAAGAVTIEPNGDMTSNIETKNGTEQLETTFQAQYTENVGVMGYSWDEANGGKSPVTADLKTGSNWDIKFPLKETAGALLIGDAALS